MDIDPGSDGNTGDGSSAGDSGSTGGTGGTASGGTDWNDPDASAEGSPASGFPGAGERVTEAQRRAALEAEPAGNATIADMVDTDAVDSRAHAQDPAGESSSGSTGGSTGESTGESSDESAEETVDESVEDDD
jgi:hypothetical protein